MWNNIYILFRKNQRLNILLGKIYYLLDLVQHGVAIKFPHFTHEFLPINTFLKKHIMNIIHLIIKFIFWIKSTFLYCVIKGAHWIICTTIFSPLSNSSFIQYCDSNIGLFCNASHIIIALPTIATAIVVALSRSYRR